MNSSKIEIKNLFEPLSSIYKVSAEEFKKRKILNPTFNTDVNLFIDPTLLGKSKFRIFNRDAKKVYSLFFKGLYEKIITISQLPNNLQNIAKENLIEDIKSREQVGLCLGFSKNNTNGRGIGKETALQLINAAYRLINAAEHTKNPSVFSVLFLLEKNIGPDFISDMTAQIIKHQLAQFTEENAREIGIETKEYQIDRKKYQLPKHPLNENYILLVPCDILSELPIEDNFKEVLETFTNIPSNDFIKARINKDIGIIFQDAYKERKKEKDIKAEIQNYLYKNPEAINELVLYMETLEGKAYDFSQDKKGINIPQKLLERDDLKKIHINTNKHKLEIIDDLIKNFVLYVENTNDLKRSLLWTKEGCVTEAGWQSLFNTFINQTLKTNNIDITPECETGVGPVDFKFSEGETFKVLVELKLSSNTKYCHGYEQQLERYKAATTNVIRAYFLFIDVELDEENSQKKKNRLLKIREDKKIDSHLIFLDGKIQPSASKS